MIQLYSNSKEITKKSIFHVNKIPRAHPPFRYKKNTTQNQMWVTVLYLVVYAGVPHILIFLLLHM